MAKRYNESYELTIVNISSAQILNMGTSPIELLPAPGVGKYYDIDKIVFELTFGTTQYATTSTILYIDALNTPSIDSQLITYTSDFALIVKSGPQRIYETDRVTSIGLPVIYANAPVIFSTWDGDDPTLGDGTLRVKIYHKTVTFGA